MVIYIPIVFEIASLIDAGESKKSQNLIQDKRKGDKPNPSNLKTQWDKTRDYVGVFPKCGMRHCMLILFIDDSTLDYYRAISIHLCDYKRSYIFPL